MQGSERPAWQKEFKGRVVELALLMDCWRKVAAEHTGPQFVLLLGDSGFGKTRLIHEFYHRISIEENAGSGEGYWPDRLTDDFEAMQVNPGVCDESKDIPWMWWGLRWPQRIGIRAISRNEGASDGLRGSLPYLEAHAFPLIKQRALRHDAFAFAWSAGQVAAAFLPLASFGVQALKWLHEAKELAEGTHHGHHLWKWIKERFAPGRKEEPPQPSYRAALHADEQRELSDKALHFARAFLDTSVKELPTIPLILVLDDAQEADPTSLHFVEKLYRAATFGQWPLLVIATHWERNWKIQEDQPLLMPPSGDPPGTFFQLVERLFQGEKHRWRESEERSDVYTHPRFHPLPVGRLDECANILAFAYPGLGEQARAHILGLGHGNPKILTDFVHLMTSRLSPQQRWCWQGDAPASDLSPAGLDELRKLPIKHAEILTLLIEDVRTREPHVIETLSVSSHQGIQFLHDLTTAVACELGRPSYEAVAKELQRAAHPHNLTAPLPQARAPASEFREALVCELLHTAHPDVTRQQLRETLFRVLLRWFHDGRFCAHPEAGRLYSLLLAFFDEAETRQDPAAARSRLRTLAEYFVWLHAQWEFRLAAVQLARLDALARALPEWPSLEWLPFDLQLRVIESGFLPQQNHASALRWCEELLKQLPANTTTAEGLRQRYFASILRADALHGQHGARAFRECRQAYLDAVQSCQQLRQQFGDSPEALRDESVSLNRLGVVELVEGNRAGAKDRFEAGLKIDQQRRQQFGDSPEALRDESVSLGRLGDVKMDEGNRAGARSCFEAALKLCQQLRQQFGDSPEALRDEAGSLQRLGDLELDEGNRARARSCFEAALKLCQYSRQQFGDSPQTLRDESLSLGRLGGVELAEGNRAGAKGRFEAELKLCQQLRQQFGDSSEALHDEAGSLQRLGDMQRDEGNRAGAKDRFEAALKLCQQLRQQFGDSPEALRDESVILGKLGNFEFDEGNRAGAKGRFEASLKIDQQLRQLFGDSPEALRDEAGGLNDLGELELDEGNHAGAKGRFEAALKLCQYSRQQFGDSPQSLRDEGVSLSKLGGVERAEGNRAGAKRRFEASLKIDQQLRQQFGDSPQALRDEAGSLERLGDLELTEGNRAGAKELFQASLKLRQQLRRQFGDNPQILRNELVSLSKLGGVELADGNRAGAKGCFEESLHHFQQLRQQFGDSPEALRDELVCLQWLGDLELREGNRTGARERFEASLTLCQKSRQQFGDSPLALRDEAASLNNLGNVELAEVNPAGAKERFEAALKLRQQLRQQFGDSPEALRHEALSRAGLALVASAGEAWAEAVNELHPVLELFALVLDRYGQTPQSVQDYVWAAGRFIESCEKAGQPERAKSLREWLESLKSEPATRPKEAP